MARFFRISMLLVAAGLMATSAFANLPSPENTLCPDFLTVTPGPAPAATPNSLNTFDIIIQGTTGPLVSANVSVVVTASADALICWCPGQLHPIVNGTTDGTGLFSTTFRGGGCYDPARTGESFAVQLFASGVLMCEMGINSPDAVNADGDLPTDDGYEFDPIEPDPNAPEDPAICIVGLADAVFHTGPIVSGDPEPCSDFTPPADDGVGTVDAVLVTPFIVEGTQCP